MKRISKVPMLLMALVSCMAVSIPSRAQNVTTLKVDASAATPEPHGGYFHMGTAVSPSGERLEINNQYLTDKGLPMLPVMGEFHYSRSPADSWLAELQKMKSAGVNVVASYIIWNHHEEQEGRFNWSGNRDLHRFLQLCQQAGLKVVLRIGPWAHAEARYGGIPDWVVDAMRTRGNDPQYLHYVERLYGQIAAQAKGELWKDGGPVIGIQLENEYNLRDEGQGAAHIQTLKAMAVQAGLDAPLYTVTGWDGTVYPSGEVTPVFGGYPDEPWGTSIAELPPKETYAFRFGSRVSGDLGAETTASAPGTAETDIGETPFLGAEYGAGLPAMYRRRTLVSPDDIASMLPVQLGSGVNLLGYYMFHGGRNPSGIGGTSMEESSLSGGYNDTPRISYDFQAPLGPDGQQRPVLNALRPFHYFLNDFGSRLAPMMVRKPEHVATDASDLSTPRWSVRSRGDSAFVFFNNHVRQYAMAQQKSLQFSVALPHETVVFPRSPIDIAKDGYFIWPVNFDLDGFMLRYATAQPVTRIDGGKEGVVYVFAASPGVPIEFSFPEAAASMLQAPGAQVMRDGANVVVQDIRPGLTPAFTLARPDGVKVQVLVLTLEQSRQLSVGEVAGKRRVVISAQDAYFADGKLEVCAVDVNQFKLAVFPALTHPHAGAALKTGADGIFQTLQAELPLRRIDVVVTAKRTARAVPPVMRGGLAQAALQPLPESFKTAATWDIAVQRGQLKGVDDAYLQIDFNGDVGRLFAGTHMLDDWYYNGQKWQVGLKQLAAALDQPLTVSVLPLRADAPVYIDKEHRPDFGGNAQIADLKDVRVLPVYRLEVR